MAIPSLYCALGTARQCTALLVPRIPVLRSGHHASRERNKPWAPQFLDSSWFHSLCCEDSRPLCAALVELGYSRNIYVLPLPWWDAGLCFSHDALRVAPLPRSFSILTQHLFLLPSPVQVGARPGWELRSEGSGMKMFPEMGGGGGYTTWRLLMPHGSG